MLEPQTTRPPKIDIEDPKRANDLIEWVEPSKQKSITLICDPNLVKLRKDIELPSCTN
jgi:hypothetical protein